jgi:three-Cys-motif partner protein
MTAFGGDWTVDKLKRVTAYLTSFQTVLKNQNFDLVYIDAFSGDGGVELRGDELPLLEIGRVFTEGSAQRALSLRQPFDRYHFIDASQASIDRLGQYIRTERKELVDRVCCHIGDVNVELPKAIATLKPNERAVVFADPFGMQLDWKTIECVGSKPVDFWYLAPTSAINRVLMRDGNLPESWRTGFYKESNQGDLFGAGVKLEKNAAIEVIEDFIHGRLKNVFMMADNKLRLSDRGRPLFTLMFGCSNSSPKAFGKATKIANHLLKG